MFRSIRPRRTILALLTASLALGAGPAWAADTVDFQSNQLSYEDDNGEASTLTVETTEASITVAQTGDPIVEGTDADNRCTNGDANTITCTVPPPNGLSIWTLDMQNGDDVVTLNGVGGGFVSGGEGIDTLTGSDSNTDFEFLSGDEGNDIINTRNVGPSAFAFATGDDANGGDGSDVITTGNGADDVSGDGGGPFLAVAGADEVTGAGNGGTGTDVISTGDGDDFANAGPGDGDRVDLGAGSDTAGVRAGDGSGDVYEGGAGIDTLLATSDCCDPPPDPFTVDLAAGTVTKTSAPTESNSFANFEDLATDRGADTVFGNDGSNVIDTGEFGGGLQAAASLASDDIVTGDGIPGPPDAGDNVNPRGGADQVSTGPGNDSIDSRDGFQDRISCGPDADTVQADQFDMLDSCESITITEQRAAGADTDSPGCRIARVKRSYSRSAFTKGFPVRVTCDEAATLLLRIVATLRGGNNLTAKAGDLVLAERSVQASANVAKGTRLKPAKKLLRRFRKGKGLKARVVVEARDQYGNRSQKIKRVKVKKGGKRKRR